MGLFKNVLPVSAAGLGSETRPPLEIAAKAHASGALPDGWEMLTHATTYGMDKHTQVPCRAFYLPPIIKHPEDRAGEQYSAAVQSTRAALKAAQAALAAKGCKTVLFEEGRKVADRITGLQMSLALPQWSAARPDDAELAKLKPSEDAQLATFNAYMSEHGQSLIDGVAVPEASPSVSESPLILQPGQHEPRTLAGAAAKLWRPGGGGFLSR
jgi:hypothetical protein